MKYINETSILAYAVKQFLNSEAVNEYPDIASYAGSLMRTIEDEGHKNGGYSFNMIAFMGKGNAWDQIRFDNIVADCTRIFCEEFLLMDSDIAEDVTVDMMKSEDQEIIYNAAHMFCNGKEEADHSHWTNIRNVLIRARAERRAA